MPFGEKRKMVCAGCGLRYDDMRCGVTFLSARQEIIAIKFDTKRGKTKYGRRNGTLGYMHQKKMLLWRTHVDECVDAYERATPAARRATRAATSIARDALRAKRKASTKVASRAWWEREKKKTPEQRKAEKLARAEAKVSQ